MATLKKCPCGTTPTQLRVEGSAVGIKWAHVMGDCCGTWKVEFETGYHLPDVPECYDIAVKAWNDAGRGK